MNNKTFTILALAALIFFFNSCGGLGIALNIPIDKNKVSGMEMKFTDLNFSVKSEENFSLSEKALKANRLKIKAFSLQMTQLVEVNYMIKSFKNNKYKNYNLEIYQEGNTKKYYGKIAFFNINKNNENSPVGKYRNINVENSFFSNATNGRTAIIYEYFKDELIASEKLNLKIPTWVLLISDEPF
jgi:hypothetical protein